MQIKHKKIIFEQKMAVYAYVMFLFVKFANQIRAIFLMSVNFAVVK